MTEKNQRHTRTIFISDLHIPYEDIKALSLAMDIVKDFKLTTRDSIVIGGDLVDFYPFYIRVLVHSHNIILYYNIISFWLIRSDGGRSSIVYQISHKAVVKYFPPI